METDIKSETLTPSTVWNWLSQVPDPEIPVISVVDLGIVRDVQIKGDDVKIIVTPTYSGCPATTVIALDIETALIKNGAEKVSIETQLSPAWTTDWISEEGKQKLLAYGISPPEKTQTCAGGLLASPSGPVACPQCSSRNTERVSEFGSTPCKAAYRCRDCLEPFDHFKTI